MVPKVKGKRTTGWLAAAVIVTCYLVQTTGCYRLKKAERRERRKEVDASETIGVQEGTIVFGRVFEKGSGLQPQVQAGALKSTSNASAADEAAYQADSPVSSGYSHDVKEALWKRMAPSLQCGLDHLRFRAVGPGASQFAVAPGNAPPVPLYQIPPSCGYSMHRNSLALVMMVPYNGCNMVQEGGSYVLPMQWQGIPVSLWCVKPAATTPPPQEPQMPQILQIPQEPQILQIPQEPQILQIPQEPQILQIPQEPQILQIPQKPQFPFWPFGPMDPHSKFPPPYLFPPFTQYSKYPPGVSTVKPAVPPFPQYLPGLPLYPYFYPPLSTTKAPPTTSPKIDFPYYPPHFHPFPWKGPVPLPADPRHQSLKLPPYFYPKNFFFSYQTPRPLTTTAATTTTTAAATTTTPPSTGHPHYHLFDNFPFPLMYYHSH